MADDPTLVGTEVVDGSNEVVGLVSVLLVDPLSLTGQWLGLRLSSDGARAIVPLWVGSTDGTGRLIIPFDAATVSAAPRPRGDMLTDDEAEALMRHYGLLG